MSRAKTATEPLSISLLHRIVMEAFKQGASLAAESAAVRSAAPVADTLQGAFTDGSLKCAEGCVRSLLLRCPEQDASGGRELHQVMHRAVEAALVLGARSAAAAAEDGASPDELLRLVRNELWFEDRVDGFLGQVVEAVVARRIPLLGAEAYLRRILPRPEVEVTASQRNDGTLELRTGWIRDADTARAYQIRVERRGDDLVISERLQGSRFFGPLSEVRSRDLDTLVAVLRQAGSPETLVP